VSTTTLSRRASDAATETPEIRDDEGPIAYNPGTLTDPLPAVERAMATFRREVRGRPQAAYMKGRAALGKLRVAASEVFGGDPHNWAMADGHTATIDRLSNCIGQMFGTRGVRVVSTVCEHIGGLGAFAADPRVEVVQVPVEEIVETPGNLYFISHLAYDTNRDNSEEIAKLVNREDKPIVIVDGSQAIGQVPVNVRALGCQAYLSSAHKWLAGPQGTGLLYLRDDVVCEWPSPFRAGEPLDPTMPIGRWEPRGGQDFSRIAGLEAAIREYEANAHRGRDVRVGFVRGLKRVLGDRVRILPESAPHGRVVAFEILDCDVYPVYRALGERGVTLKCIKKSGPHDSYAFEVLRAGFPWWTSAAKVREALSILKRVHAEVTARAEQPEQSEQSIRPANAVEAAA
jgi:selenocysteine lyase/cysteine desulfurase